MMTNSMTNCFMFQDPLRIIKSKMAIFNPVYSLHFKYKFHRKQAAYFFAILGNQIVGVTKKFIFATSLHVFISVLVH